MAGRILFCMVGQISDPGIEMPLCMHVVYFLRHRGVKNYEAQDVQRVHSTANLHCQINSISDQALFLIQKGIPEGTYLIAPFAPSQLENC